MSGIPFTQYLRPNGRQVSVTIDRPDTIATLANAFIALGGKFTVEQLTTGEASFTAEWVYFTPDWDMAETVVAHEICPNGPEVPAAVDRLVRKAAFAASVVFVHKAPGPTLDELDEAFRRLSENPDISRDPEYLAYEARDRFDADRDTASDLRRDQGCP